MYEVTVRRAASAIATGFALMLGLIAGPTRANAQTTTGYIQICKESEPAPRNVTGTFNFTVQGVQATVSAPVNACSPAVLVTAGQVRITEAAVAGVGVSEIRAVAPFAGPQTQVVSQSLADRTVVVNVAAGDISRQTIVTFRNFRIPTGYLQVCKDADPAGSLTGNFQFNVPGIGTLTVPVGACSPLLTVQAGAIVITEAARVGSDLVGVTTIPPDRLVNVDLPNMRATVTVVASTDPSTQTIVRFRNRPVNGQLKICKIAGTTNLLNQVFRIEANGVGYNVPAGPGPGGFCVLDGVFPFGTVVAIQEVNVAADITTTVAVLPADREVGQNAGNRQITVRIGTGVTEVFFTNRRVEEPVRGQLKICKVAGQGVTIGTLFPISAGGVTYQVPAGPGPGGFCVIDGTFDAGTNVTVQETVPGGYQVVGVRTEPADRLVSSTGGTAVVRIGTGVTEVIFTNRRIPEDPAGRLEICKIAGFGITVGTPFTFNITGGPEAIAAQTVNAGAAPTGTCRVIGTFPAGTQLTVRETIPANVEVQTITVTPAGNQVSQSTGTGTAVVRITSETTTRVTYTNRSTRRTGCSPGFFKNHTGAWPAGFSPNQLVSMYFTGASASLASSTLLQALNFGGGPGVLGAEQILLRAAVAALLNAASSGVGYPLSVAQVRALVSAALATDNRGTILALATQLDQYNNLGCSL